MKLQLTLFSPQFVCIGIHTLEVVGLLVLILRGSWRTFVTAWVGLAHSPLGCNRTRVVTLDPTHQALSFRACLTKLASLLSKISLPLVTQFTTNIFLDAVLPVSLPKLKAAQSSSKSQPTTYWYGTLQFYWHSLSKSLFPAPQYECTFQLNSTR